ncbi:threonine--tRNA ligase [Mesomycoplasma hyopneumoniae]|uniref:Threonine--tRNA ligase n=1 Tax=Mesomycoplasma hyopneumoniae TaxID=2099 RepID=A0ABD4SXN7_MESHO|nr:threonine--tRNA ligase [Mesomycoplasma hyopneumoniae]MCI8283618.1 threonine--tRNA ligase [Mesomycoplasma hyopneumoniae]MCI8298540.1 threonine--tRNA ligase [Mesomycoplasma hyopneumoniae]MCI8298708.1 threonine--tRNA ligase [Mesomycoplasma hyopneumoniae]
MDLKIDYKLNHSSSHLLALAIKILYPDVKFGIGPVFDDGFYYDFDLSVSISQSDFPKIEKLMKKLVSKNLKIVETDGKNLDFQNQIYKAELKNDLEKKGEKITYFSIVDSKNNILFEDLCYGNHLESLGKIQNFKLLKIAGAYWKGDSKNKQLTRIYGTSWDSKENLDKFLGILQERQERDHRKIGAKLKLFTFSSYFGHGFPVWLENGMRIYNKIRQKILEFDRNYGFKEVLTPHFGHKELYKISGHLLHYRDDMFKGLKIENDELIPRPMTCPHHIILFSQQLFSYRNLPYRISEQSRLYRYEKSGALLGLERVRAMDLTEGHIFVSKSQIFSEISHLFQMISEVLDFFKVQIFYISFSKRDPKNKDKFFQDDQMWDQAEADLKQFLDQNKINYIEKIGEAAFYGPKIDFQVKTALNKELTISTLQLDFLLPKKFKISFINEHNKKETPILIHRGLIGTYERFIALLLEQSKGNLPFWISPKQIIVIPVAEKHNDFAQKIHKILFDLGFNSEIDLRSERISRKIREANLEKINFQVIIGDEEITKNEITYRKFGSSELFRISLVDFVDLLKSSEKNV